MWGNGPFNTAISLIKHSLHSNGAILCKYMHLSVGDVVSATGPQVCLMIMLTSAAKASC